SSLCHSSLLFFFTATATSASYTLSLHDALPISRELARESGRDAEDHQAGRPLRRHDVLQQVDREQVVQRDRLDRRQVDRKEEDQDRKSTRLNSSHVSISYAVFCLKKKKKKK